MTSSTHMLGSRGLAARVALTLAAALVALSARSAPTQDVDANAALFERYVEALRRIAHVPGISGVILRDRRTVWQRGFGFADVNARVPATPDTLYDIASLTKTFTSTLLLHCVERGTLSLDERIARYWSAIPEPAATVRPCDLDRSRRRAGSRCGRRQWARRSGSDRRLGKSRLPPLSRFVL